MKIFLIIIISFILIGFNSAVEASSKEKILKNNNTIDCSAEPVIRYIPIKGINNSSLMYAVLINHKERQYQLISNKKNLKCIFN